MNLLSVIDLQDMVYLQGTAPCIFPSMDCGISKNSKSIRILNKAQTATQTQSFTSKRAQLRGGTQKGKTLFCTI